MAGMKVKPGDPDDERRMSAMFGPGQIDTQVRQALEMLWIAMPPERKRVEEVEREFRRLVERALKDLREDAAAFGSP